MAPTPTAPGFEEHPEAELARLRAELAQRDAAIAAMTETVTRLHDAELALERHQRDMQAILDNLPSMIGYWDKSLRNRFANHAYSTWFGIDHLTIPGKHIRDIIGEERYRLNLPYIERALRGEEQVFERAIPAPDGSFVRHSLAHYIPDIVGDEVQGFFVLVSDITAVKGMEDELRRANEDLEQFAYAASHDLREPLRMISSYMGLLERRYAATLPDDAREFIHFARDGAARLDKMVLDLLEFSRVGRRGEPPERLALNDVIAAVMDNQGPAAAEAGVRITVADDLGSVTGVRSELIRLFQNLLGNAVKYRAKDRPPEIAVTAAHVGKIITVAVADNGIGIPPEFTERVFAVFQRLHTQDEYDGSGIGLAICRKIAHHHGGRVWLQSEEGRGTTVFVALAAAEPV